MPPPRRGGGGDEARQPRGSMGGRMREVGGSEGAREGGGRMREVGGRAREGEGGSARMRRG